MVPEALEEGLKKLKWSKSNEHYVKLASINHLLGDVKECKANAGEVFNM